MISQPKKTKKRTLFCVLLSLFLCLCFVRYALQIYFPRVILLVLFAVMSCISDRDELLALCICCIPLNTTFHYFYGMLICMAVFFVKYHRIIHVNLSFVPIFLMLLWEMMHCLTQEFSIISFGSDFLPFLLLLLIMCLKVKEFDYAFITRVLAVCIAFMCIMLLGRVLYVARFNLTAAVTNLRRLGMDTKEAQTKLTIEGGQQNPNSLGIMCVLGITGLMQLRFSNRGRKSDIFLILGLLFFGVLTSSRTYLACLAIMGVLLYFSQKGTIGKKILFICRIAILILAILFLMNLLFPQLLEAYIERFFFSDITSGRAGLMQAYHKLIVTDGGILLKGIGKHNYAQRLMGEFRVANNLPHNFIQEIIIAWGVPGIGLFVMLGLAMITISRRFCKKQGLINYIPIIIVIAKSVAGQMLDSPYTLLTLSYSYLSMCENLKFKEDRL